MRRALEARAAEVEGLRELARAMATAPSSRDLMQVVCDAAVAQCHAEASAVCRVIGDQAEVVASSGHGAPYIGYRFALAGTATAIAMQRRAVVAESSQAAAARARPTGLRAAARDYEVGPFVVTPLVAHGEVLGTLALMRTSGARSFTGDEEERLAVIADHASIALKKARLAEEAQAASEAKSNFLAIISHELRTPLTALAGYGELLADEILGPMPPEQHEIVERMRSVTHHLTVMIDEILTFSSIESGRERVRFSDVSPSEVVTAAAAVIQPLAEKKGIAFHATNGVSASSIRTDGDKVRQILVNLGGNAVKFTDEGEVRLELEVGDSTIRFHVTDTGIGISQEDQKRLFQPFGQIDTALTRRHSGAGLGLYVSHRLAGLLGGWIDVRSTQGSGSRFSLVLPLD